MIFEANYELVTMRLSLAASLLTAVLPAMPAMAQEQNCLMGKVTFRSDTVDQVLTLRIHEQPVEVPAGLYGIAELPPLGGVLSIYPEPRPNRRLANSGAMAADMMSFDASGKVLNLMQDTTGVEVDRMESGVGMLYAAYLAGGTIEATGFNHSTVMTGWDCIEYE